jgi:RNA polymerase sigma-70 factor (ECF subfamily)
MSNLENMQWIRRSRSGDTQAFAHLYEAYKNLVYRTAYLLLDDPAEAQDALQETFLQAYRALNSYDPARGAISTWLYRITVNHSLNRRRARRPQLHLEPAQLEALSGANDLEQQVSENQMLQQALERLNEKLRVVVVLRYYLELSYAEIAQVLEIPLGTVQSRLSQAVHSLRRDLQAAEPSGDGFGLEEEVSE